MTDSPFALGQHAVDDQHVIAALARQHVARLAVAGEMGGVAGLRESLFQIVGRFAVVLDDQELHVHLIGERGTVGQSTA